MTAAMIRVKPSGTGDELLLVRAFLRITQIIPCYSVCVTSSYSRTRIKV